MSEVPRDLVVQLKALGITPWDGREDANVDFIAVFASGRSVSFTAITPQNILTLWRTSYPEARAMVMPGMLVVRRIDEESLWEAVHDWLELEERAAYYQRQAEQDDEDAQGDSGRAADKQDP